MTQFTDRPEIDRKLLAKGVENLSEFGYTTVTVENITTDMVFAKFFRSMLEENLGHADEIDEAINRLIAEIDTSEGGDA